MQHLFLRLTLTLLVMIISIPAGVFPAHATQNERAISVSLPGFWRDTIDLDAIIAEFEAQHPGTRVEVRYQNGFQIGGNIATNVDAALEEAAELAGSADVVYVDNTTLNQVGTRAGYFLDLTPLVSSDTDLNTADFYPNIWESFQWNDGIWGLPVSANLWLVSYLPAAFDKAGLAYPADNWSLEDYFFAAEQLTQYDETGEVSVPGILAGFGGGDLSWLVRATLGYGFYDSTTFPEQPAIEDPAIAELLERWIALEEQGVIGGGMVENIEDVPLRFGSLFIGARGGPGGDQPVVEDALLPGGVAGLEVQGFAVSSGTPHPDLAYAFAKFLSLRPEIGNNFLGDTPARMSLQGTEASSGSNGGPGGGPIFNGGTPSATVQAIIDGGLVDTLPASEIRYSEYLTLALDSMRKDGLDGLTALQDAQTQAITNLQTVENDTTAIAVTPPEAPRTLNAGEIELKVGISLAGGGGFIIGGNGGLPNQEVWDALNDRFSASDPDVGYVEVEQINGLDLTDLTENYECFITASNLVPDTDLSGLLNIDPFLDSDPNFDRNDLLGTSLSQVQRDDLTWAYPISISPQTLRYNADLFNQNGLNLPTQGWTIDQFVDALTLLESTVAEDGSVYVPNDPTGNYILKLMAAYGGLPIDYRTNPPTINFTDPANVEAAQQVLDLVKAGYIDYNELGGQGVISIMIDGESIPPIQGNLQFGLALDDLFSNSGTQVTLYPSGTQYGVLSYDITAGYISANSQNASACYRYLSAVAQSPQLFNGIPANRTLVSDPIIAEQLAPGMAELGVEVERLMRDPNTITFPVSFGRGGLQVTNWLFEAFDDYVLNDADLATGMADAEQMTLDYLSCIEAVDTTRMDNFEVFQTYDACARSVDPEFGG